MMNKILTLAGLFFLSLPGLCATELELNKVRLPEAISLVYSDVLKVPFMLDPQLVNDERMVTFKITPDVDERAFITRYFQNMNIRIYTQKGIDYLSPFTPQEPVKPRQTWVYTPKYRSVSYLSDILSGYVSGSFNNSGTINSNNSPTSATGAASYINRSGDILVYYGTREDIEVLKTLVASLDTISEEVIVSGYVFEVQTAQSDGSGILLAAKILSEKFNISIGSANNLDNVISIKTGSVDAVFSLLKTDSRFTVVSAPRLRVKNNASASFSVGADVPVLGNVTFNNDTAVQSVDYRSSGVLFNVTPSIKSQTMDLKIQQQLSNFVTTETGVNNSPTLIKRDVTTEVSLADGDVILLGGLAEQKDSTAKSGWSFLGSKTKENSKNDIMVMLQVSKVDRSKTLPRSAARSGGLFQGNPD
ncbi:Putative secretin [Pectobacterium versatile]|nr:Putative secretin [Pectobacterium versatile]